MMIILVDQDDVLADFDGRVREILNQKYPGSAGLLRYDQKTTTYYEDQRTAGLDTLTQSIYQEKGFYVSLNPIPGGKEALNEMKQQGADVFICTSPIFAYEHCVLEKYHWVKDYFGREWTGKMILARDKTIVQGDILIDDNPAIKGVGQPVWEHIVYDQKYNRHIKEKRRLTWQNWKSVLKL